MPSSAAWGWTSAAPRRRWSAGRWGPDGCCDYRVWYNLSGELLRAPGDKAPYPAAPGLRVAFCPGEERRMAPLAGEVHMDAFLRLPFVLDEPWED